MLLLLETLCSPVWKLGQCRPSLTGAQSGRLAEEREWPGGEKGAVSSQDCMPAVGHECGACWAGPTAQGTGLAPVLCPLRAAFLYEF